MMKNKTIILIISLTIVLGIGIAVILRKQSLTPKKENTIELTSNKYPGDTAKNITMTIKEGTLTNKSATVIIKDLSGKNNLFGVSFMLYKKSGNDWYSIKAKSDLAWELKEYNIDENHTLELPQSFGYWGELPPGEYKIAKSTKALNEEEFYYFSTNFTIN